MHMNRKMKFKPLKTFFRNWELEKRRAGLQVMLRINKCLEFRLTKSQEHILEKALL